MTEQEKLEKIIKRLECNLAMRRGEKILCEMEYCPYWSVDDDTGMSLCNNYQIQVDAIALLKAQEPVEPILDVRHGKSMWRCGSCSTALQPNQMHAKFCFNCGKKVKWE